MSGPVSERPAGTRRVLEFIHRVGQPVARRAVREKFPHTSPKLLQEILTSLVEDGDLEVETDVDRELDTFTPVRATGRRRAPPAKSAKTLREELDELLEQRDTWTVEELLAALPHRSLDYLGIAVATERKASRLVSMKNATGQTVYCRPQTAAKHEANSTSAAGVSPDAAVQPAATVAASPACAAPVNEGEQPVEESTANARQVGGAHYKKWAIQPWDFIERNGLTFCSGNVIKYVCRYRDKAGVEDLEKAKHYLEKLIEVERERAEQ